MNIFAYVPWGIENYCDASALIKKNFANCSAVEIIQESDQEEFLSICKHCDYAAIIFLIDTKTDKPFELLSKMNLVPLKGPIVALYQNGDNTTLFNLAARGIYSAFPFDKNALGGDTLEKIVSNARRSYASVSSILNHGPFCVNFPERSISIYNKEIPFTAGEFDIMAYLARRKDVVCSREQLLAETQADISEGNDLRMIDSHIKRIRKKIERECPGASAHIATYYKCGYSFVDKVSISPEMELKAG